MLRRLVAALAAVTIIAPSAMAAPAEPYFAFKRIQEPRAAIRIDATRPASAPLPNTLFGTFTENIWDAVYGGVWAQILHNPSFEADNLSVGNMLDAARYGRIVTDPSFGSGYVRLEPLTEEQGESRFVRSSMHGLPVPWEELRRIGMRYEPREGDAPNSHRWLWLMGMAGKEVGIRQGVYLPIHRTRRYNGSVWIKGTTPTSLTVSVRHRDLAEQVIASTSIPVTGKAWTRKTFTLELPAGRVNSLQKVDFVLSVNGETRLGLDNVLFWPSDAVEGFDPEVIAEAKALKTRLLRFGGNFTSGYHWQDGVGPMEKRRTLLNQAWGLPEYNHFGTDEFIRLCRLIGAEPHITVNAGSGDAQEAAAWVEYCNGPATSRYGAMRAANGHREPYRVKYWEVGNELWGDFQIGWQTAESNARRYVEFAGAMRKVDPSIRLIATGGDIDFYSDWNAALIKTDGNALDMVSTHLVIGMQPGEQVQQPADDAHTYRADMAVPVGVGRRLDEMIRQLQGDAAKKATLAFTEWQFWSPRSNDLRFNNMGGAVNAAAFFGMLARRAQDVPVSNMSNLVQFAGIHRQRGKTFVTPSYYVAKMFFETAGSRIVPLSIEAPGYDVVGGNRRIPNIEDVPEVEAVSFLSADGKTLRIMVWNRTADRAIPITYTLHGFKATAASVSMLSSPSVSDANSPETGNSIRPQEYVLHNLEEDISMPMPAHSVAMIVLTRK